MSVTELMEKDIPDGRSVEYVEKIEEEVDEEYHSDPEDWAEISRDDEGV